MRARECRLFPLERSPTRSSGLDDRHSLSSKPLRYKGDIMSPEKCSAVMAQIKWKDTGPERQLAAALANRGLTWESHARDLPGRPDFVFRDKWGAIFVDGDFWHGWRFPQWQTKLSKKGEAKIDGNCCRDVRNHRQLRRRGWTAIRLWEHQVTQAINACVNRILRIIEKNISDVQVTWSGHPELGKKKS